MNRDLVCRAAGVGFLALGALLAYWSIWEPLELARSGAAEITSRMKGVLAVPVGLVIGIVYLLGGAKADALFRQPGGQRPTGKGVLVLLVAIGLGALLYWWFGQQLAGMGYVES